MLQQHRTKIIATIGPASRSKQMITELVKAGVDIFRLNFSHGTHEEHLQVIEHIKAVNQELETSVGILADLQGPKIRLGVIKGENGAEKLELKTGDIITLTTRDVANTASLLPVTYPDFARDVGSNEKILIDDGQIALQSTDSNGIDEVTAKVIYGGWVSSKKGVNLPETNLSTPSLTPKDIRDLQFILTQDVSWIALSFVRSAEEISQLKGIIRYNQHSARVIAKIEKPEAMEDIDRIIRVSDAVMMARGDLGVEMPLEKIPIMQKQVVNKCIEQAKPVIIATQMMQSMIKNPSPTRAEITDVSNAIFEGADALMLSGETAVGKYPLEVINHFMKVIKTVEQQSSIYDKHLKADPNSDTYLSDAICYNACKIAIEVQAKAILGMTTSGYTAFMLASYRPSTNIYIFTANRSMLPVLNLVWGVRAFYYNKFESTDGTIRDVQRILREKGLIGKGDIVINTGSMPIHERGRTNTIKISLIN